MRRNIDQKEQSRRNNDVCVHLEVAIERHFSDTIRRPFAHSLRNENVSWSKLSQLIGAISRSEGLASFSVHGDALEYPRPNSSPCAILRIQSQRKVSSSAHDQIVDASSNPERLLAHIHNSAGRSQEISNNQQRQVFRKSHAENNSALLACNKNGSRHSDRRDECTTITKFVSLSFTSFVNLVFYLDQSLPANSCNLPTRLSLRRRRDKLCQ